MGQISRVRLAVVVREAPPQSIQSERMHRKIENDTFSSRRRDGVDKGSDRAHAIHLCEGSLTLSSLIVSTNLHRVGST